MNYHNITKDDMLNGEGIRVVLWVAGCSHACPGCHNPETWSPSGGILFDKQAKQEIFDELEKDYVSGLTFSGGDPLFCQNRTTVTSLAKEVKEKFNHKNIWLWTGYLWEEIKHLPIMPYLDVVCDGRFVLKQLNTKLRWVGSSNQRIIDVKASLFQNKVVIYDKNEF